MILPVVTEWIVTLRAGVLRRLTNRRFWRDSGLLMLANVIVIGLGLVRTPLMTWMLPKDEIGMLGVVAAWLPFLQLLSLSGLDTASYHYVARGQPWAFVAATAARLRWSLLSALGFLLAAAVIAWQGQTLLAWMFTLAGISFPLTAGLSACAGMLGAQQKYTALFWYRIWESLTDFTGFLPLALGVWWISQAATFYGANQVATTVMLVGLSLWYLRDLRRSGQPPLGSLDRREMLRYGKNLTIMNGIGVLQQRTDALIVGALLPFGVMADYSIAMLIYEQIKRVWNVYLTVRYPPLVRLPPLARKQRIAAEGLGVLLAFIAMGFGVIFFSHLVIPLILPAAYRGSLVYIDLLTIAFIAGIPGFMAEFYFRTQQDERRLYQLRLGGAVVGALMPAVLISTLGERGVAVSRLASGAAMSILGILVFYRDKPTPPLPNPPAPAEQP
jgi:O-antigen/teichoic acid export membrane protein